MKPSIFYSISIGFASGIVCRSFFIFPLEVFFILSSVVASVTLILYRRSSSYTYLVLAVLCAIVACGLGAWRTENASDAIRYAELTPLTNTKVEVVGTVSEEPDEREQNTLLTLETESPKKGIVLVSVTRATPVAYGDRVSVEGTLQFPTMFEGDFGRTFHYPEYLAARGITHTLRASNVVVLDHGEGNWLVAHLYTIKNSLTASVDRAIPEPAAGLGLGITLGEKRAIGKELTKIFRIAGLIHIIVLSGYNISILAEFLMRILAPVLSLRRRLFVGGVVILLVVLMVGPSASVVRAALMALLVLLARATGKTYDVARSLFFAGTAMLLWNPLLLMYDPGFQFSFLATLGLILVASEIEKWLLWLPTHFQIREFLVATLAAQIMVLPLLLYSTGLFSTFSIVANLLVLPVTPLAMLLTTMTALFGFVSSILALIVGYPTYLLLSYILFVAETISKLPYAAIPVPPFSFWFVVCAYTCIGGVLVALWRANRKKLPLVHKLPPKATPSAGDAFPF